MPTVPPKGEIWEYGSHRIDDRGVVEVLDTSAYMAKHPHRDVDIFQCGRCRRKWDDAVITSWTPAPSARCPFEYEHGGSVATATAATKIGLVEHMWKYPLFATCRYCGELLQFDVDPDGTPGLNGDWGAVSEHGADYGCGEHPETDEDGTHGHEPTDIEWDFDLIVELSHKQQALVGAVDRVVNAAERKA